MEKVKYYLYILPAISAIFLALGGLKFYDYLPWGCWIRTPPFSESYLPASLFGIVWIILSTSVSTAAVITIFITVFRQTSISAKWRANEREIATEVYHQGLFYLINLYLSWPIIVVGIFITGSQNFVFWCLVFFFAPIQVRLIHSRVRGILRSIHITSQTHSICRRSTKGFTNFLVYVRPRIIRRIRNKSGQKKSLSTRLSLFHPKRRPPEKAMADGSKGTHSKASADEATKTGDNSRDDVICEFYDKELEGHESPVGLSEGPPNTLNTSTNFASCHSLDFG